jgi:hypothetical protein
LGLLKQRFDTVRDFTPILEAWSWGEIGGGWFFWFVAILQAI